MKVFIPVLRSCLLALALGSPMATSAMTDEPGNVPQPLLFMENQMNIEGKMTAVFTGDKVSVSIQGGPLEIPLGEHINRESKDADPAVQVPEKKAPRALGAAALDDREYDRFGRDAQDLSMEVRPEIGNARSGAGHAGPWAQLMASYLQGGLFSLDPALGFSGSAVSRTRLRQVKVSSVGRLTRPQKLHMQARMHR
ncbi:hypothetical protein [Thermithiobacillus plumbiphilus]|uniref:Uncharacterized protein n=1 Tax=Thermithiobacillus plumbiphilus TaxID=1729899 RepID=A0ABU9DAD9_9PROT